MNTSLFLGFIIVGVLFISTGVMLRIGRWRVFYTIESMPVYAQREIFNVAIPIGIGAIAIAMPIGVPGSRVWADPLLYISFPVTMILAIWQPWWMKPAWLRWLEDNYFHVIDAMFAEARKMGRRAWSEQVKTQEGLETWAHSVAKKNGWQRLHPE